MKKHIIFFVSILLLLPVSTQTVFYNCTVLRNKKTGQRVFALADMHVDELNMRKTLNQQAELLAVIQNLKGQVRCLVEDSIQQKIENITETIQEKDPDFLYALQQCFAGRFDNTGAQGNNEITNLFKEYINIYPELIGKLLKVSPLTLLEKHLNALNVPCKNIEIRGVINDFKFKNKDMQATYENLSHLNDKEGKGLQGLYRTFMAKTVNSIKSYRIKQQLLYFMYDKYPVFDTCSMIEASTYMVDIAAIDDIYQHLNVQNIFICAGGRHTEKIIEFLISTGDYKEIAFVGHAIDVLLKRFRKAQGFDNPILPYGFNVKQAITPELKKARQHDEMQREKKALQLPAYREMSDAVKSRIKSKL
ncbi:MAG TPA: hypothetical protein VGT41_06240 [Candidatus Babeliales bacterium]|nr:hypothetical protein [Candidatus Babeliales bacterium]